MRGNVPIYALLGVLAATAFARAGVLAAAQPGVPEDTSSTRGGWVKYAVNPLPSLDWSTYGTIFDITVLPVADSLKMWVSWRANSCNAYTHGKDGIKWSKPVCVLGTTNSGWEDNINRLSVLFHNGMYHMWYTGQANGTSKIGYATSLNGIDWTRKNNGQPVLSAATGWEKPSVMNPNVIWDSTSGNFKMWYCGGEDYEPDAVGYATSPDGIAWTKHAGNPVFAKVPGHPWEAVKVAGAQVIKDPWGPGGRKGYLMFYIGYRTVDSTDICMAFSENGITDWIRYADNPIISPSKNNGFDASACYKPFAVLRGNQWQLWYNGRNGAPEQIALATHVGADLGFPPVVVSTAPSGLAIDARPKARPVFLFQAGEVLFPGVGSGSNRPLVNVSGQVKRTLRSDRGLRSSPR